VRGYRTRLRAADGSVKDVLIDGQGLFRNGVLVHSRCFTHDVTGLLEVEAAARQRLEEASRLQDEFLALLSHELRAPLGTVLIWLGLLRPGGSDRDEPERALEIMERSARTLEHIVEDLLHASRIAAGGLSIVPHLLDLRTVVADAVDAAAGDARANGLDFAWVPGPSPVPVLADPGRLQQAIANLLSNALKFTPPGGRVEVRLETEDRQAKLSVSDSGEGMSPGFLPFAFGRFRQQDPTSTRRHHGLGLGRYVVRHVIVAHGGTVQAESAGPSRGSTFTVVLPLVPDDAGRGAPAPAFRADAPDLSRPAGLKVLVVDDEHDVREALRLILEQNGAVVTSAASVGEAIAALEAARPDVILSDIAMPEEDGISFIRRVRAFPAARGGRVPAAALSAYASADHRRLALRAGFQDHVPKPIEPAHLLGVIARLAGHAVAPLGERGR
jgi:signal transduction histidine kinase/CheY-like chemotaxis protein